MQDTDSKTRSTVYIDNKLLKQLDNCFQNYGYKSRNQFILEAIESHIANVTLENMDDIFAKKLASAMAKQTESLGKKVSKGLYRYAVELSIIMHILAWKTGLTDQQIKGIRGRAMKEVKGLRGRINLEAISDFQHDIKNQYYSERVDDEWLD